MRRFILMVMACAVVLMPLCADDGQVAFADVQSSVTGYLLHGFLDEKDKNLTDGAELKNSVIADDALSQKGATLTYIIKTNKDTPLVIYANVTPFKQDASTTAKIAIASVAVDGVTLTPITGLEFLPNEQPSDSTGEVSNEDVTDTQKYELIDFQAESGKNEYDYTINVKANQNDVAEAPAGHYISSFTLSMASKS